jgi:ubiquinone/menaquinone biosynthesis C-methylase UbiE
MFAGDSDCKLLIELKRILRPGGKAIILPLYMHTHYCSFSTPEYYGKGYSDSESCEYLCADWTDIPSARYYDAVTLKKRVLDLISSLGMKYKIYVLRNKDEFDSSIYCHFILEIEK